MSYHLGDDLEKVEKDIYDEYGDFYTFNEDNIRHDIEKLKAMTEEEIRVFFEECEEDISDFITEAVKDEYGFPDEAWADFWKAHPDLPNVDDDGDEIDSSPEFFNWIDSLPKQKRMDYLWIKYETISDNITDEMRRQATAQAANINGVSVFTVMYFCENAAQNT